MKLPYSNNPEKTRQELAIDCIKHLIRSKLLFNSKDPVALILLGTEENENALFENSNSHKNITYLRNLIQCDFEFFTFLDNLKSTESEGSVIDALEVAIDAFDKEIGKKKYDKRV